MKRDRYLNKQFKHSNLNELLVFLEYIVDDWDLNILLLDVNSKCHPNGYAVLQNKSHESIIIAEIYGLHLLSMDEFIVFANSKEKVLRLLDIVTIYSGKIGKDDLWEDKFKEILEPKKEAHKVL